MAASSTLIVDMTTVVTNGPSAASLTLAIAAAGPIQDYQGNCNLVLLKFKEASKILIDLVAQTDASDPNKTQLTAVQHAIAGTSAPSTTLITDINTAIVAAPTAATQALNIAPAGKIMDYVGMVHVAKRKLQEAKTLLARVIAVTDAGDGSLTLLNNINLALA